VRKDGVAEAVVSIKSAPLTRWLCFAGDVDHHSKLIRKIAVFSFSTGNVFQSFVKREVCPECCLALISRKAVFIAMSVAV